jgi:subtilisin family serine protease
MSNLQVSVRTCAGVLALLLILAGCDAQSPLSADDSSLSSTALPEMAALSAAPQLAVSDVPDLSALPKMSETYVVMARRGGVAGVRSAAEAQGARVTFAHEATGVVIVEGLSAEGAAALSGLRSVTDIQADVLLPMEEPFSTEAPEAAEIESPSNPAGAFFFPRQWNMRAIGADKAWAAGKTGSSDVTVAILDTGIDYLHTDLIGLVDLSRSASFIASDDVFVNAIFPGQHPITDIGFHGTHVASTVASNSNAAAGVSSRTTLMGVKVCSVVDGGCPFSSTVAGLLHAADNGADVINMSLGGSFLKRNAPGIVAYLNTIFQYISRQGTLVVVSAGNSAIDLDRDGNSFKTYCNVAGVICVSATGPTAGGTFSTGPWTNVDAPATYTNYGRSAINVAAPGGNMGTSVIAACSSTNLLSNLQACRASRGFVVGSSGTSMAAPHVSGLAALLLAEGHSPKRVALQMERTADDLGARGTDAFYGKGRINAAAALGL